MQVVAIDRVVVTTDDVGRTTETLTDRLGIDFGELLSLTTETTAGTNEFESAIDRNRIGIDVVSPSGDDEENAVRRFLTDHGRGLYALALQVADLDRAKAELAADGVGPVGEIVIGQFTE